MTDESTDTENSVEQVDDVELEVADEVLEDGEPSRSEVEEAEMFLKQANNFHQVFDQAKQWSQSIGHQLAVKADLLEERGELDEDEAESLRQIANRILSVYNRVEYGDTNSARNS